MSENPRVPDLSFEVASVEPVLYAAAPLLNFKLRLTNANAGEWIQTVALRVQLQIDVTKRHYDVKDHERLLDLFGAPDRWSQTLRAMLWTFSTCVVLPFQDATVADLHVPCTFDFNVAASKYFYALDDGEVPLTLLFSGTIFYENEEGNLQVAQVPWSKEAIYRLPVKIWQDMMDHYYPGLTWFTLQKDTFDKLYRYKARHGIPTWEQVVERLLKSETENTAIIADSAK